MSGELAIAGIDAGNITVDLAVGTVIADQYQILCLLGSGGMSQVYCCEDLQLHRLVAVKLLHHFTNGHALTRFQREAQIVSKLAHDNIVKVYGLHVTSDKEPFIVMEYVEGESLEKLLERTGPWRLPRVMKFVSQISSALAAAHEQGIIHRDLKPSNIMVINPGTTDEMLKLLDFGIAKIANDSSVKTTRTGEVFGSPAYMSPQQAQGKAVDNKTDQYSLGCLIFELLTGRPPFIRDGFLNTMMAHVVDTPPVLSETSKRKFPPQIDLVVARLLEKEPAKRFASIEDFEQAFHLGTPVKNKRKKPKSKLSLPPLHLLATTAFILFILCSIVAFFRSAPSALRNSQSTNNLECSIALTRREKLLLFRLKAEPLIETLDLSQQRITDEGMRGFANVHFVKHISLIGCDKITDVGLNYLVGLRLVTLYLNDTRLSDIGMQSICQIPTLESLDISETDISDTGCRYLENLSGLKVLHMNWTSTSGAALSNIAKLGNLEVLHLNGDAVSGNLSAIEALDLRDLRLEESGLSDTDMIPLAKMQSLLELDISTNKGITDAGLLKLASLTNLRILKVADCSATETGIKTLKGFLPLCDVRTLSESRQNVLKLFQGNHGNRLIKMFE
jgi:serine/threonine protein kinase